MNKCGLRGLAVRSAIGFQTHETHMYEIRWIITLSALIQSHYSETRCIIDNTTHFSYRNINRSSMKRNLYWEAISSAASQETPHISWNPKVHYRIHERVTTALLGFVAYRFRKRNIKWWLNMSTLQPKMGCCTSKIRIVTIDDGISLMKRQFVATDTVCRTEFGYKHTCRQNVVSTKIYLSLHFHKKHNVHKCWSVEGRPSFFCLHYNCVSLGYGSQLLYERWCCCCFC